VRRVAHGRIPGAAGRNCEECFWVNGSPDIERGRGQEHAEKAVIDSRRLRRCAARPAWEGKGCMAWSLIANRGHPPLPERRPTPASWCALVWTRDRGTLSTRGTGQCGQARRWVGYLRHARTYDRSKTRDRLRVRTYGDGATI